MVDFKWLSAGGLMLDGSGDIAVTGADTPESILDMIRTRLKAAFDGWQLYRIGAGLSDLVGHTVNEELDIKTKRQVLQALSSDILPRSAYQIEVLHEDSSVTVLVYGWQQLVARVVLNRSGGGLVVQ